MMSWPSAWFVVKLRRNTGLDFGLPGTWFVEPRDDGSHGQPSAVCPECRGIATLADHRVRYDGLVLDRAVCRCGFSAHFILAGWGDLLGEVVEAMRRRAVVAPKSYYTPPPGQDPSWLH